MSHPNSSSISSICPQRFLKQNPALSHSLFSECNYNLDEVTNIIEPLFEASRRCQLTAFYVQAVTTGRTAFLATNLNPDQEMQITKNASGWLLGRDRTCAILIPSCNVSRRHAVISHDQKNFYITDIGSKNGTLVNHRRLCPNERQLLRDGDLIELGNLKAEFFVSKRDDDVNQLIDATFH